MIHDTFDPKIRRMRGKILQYSLVLESNAVVGFEADVLRKDIETAKGIVVAWVEKRDSEVWDVWDKVRKEWQGGVREVVRSDGSGEGEEMCLFTLRHGAGAADGWQMMVNWVPVE